MRCKEIEEKLIEYLDGRTKPAERRVVDEHLATCNECRMRAEEFRAIWSALDDVPVLSPSPSFDAAVRARVAAEPPRPSFWNWLPSPRLAFAVTALVIVSVWLTSVSKIKTNSPVAAGQASTESDFGMIKDLPELENYDVISKFDALSELPGPPTDAAGEPSKETR